MISPTTRKLFPYALIVFLGYMGFSLPLPLLPEMFLNPETSILPFSMSIRMKTLLLGIVIAAYPLGQLFGSPILGHWSDRWGRKKVILYSLCGNSLGYVITALAVSGQSVWGIFLGLFVCGFSEGSVTLAQAATSDLSAGDQKVKHFGLIGFSMSLGFIFGPLFGGFLANPEHGPLFTFATPFWMGAVLSLMAFAVFAYFSSETRSEKREEMGFFASFRVSMQAPLLRRYFLANFFLYLGMYSFWRFFPVFLERIFNFSTTQLAYVISYEAVAFGFAVLWLVRLFGKWMEPKSLVCLFSLFVSLMLAIVVLPPSPVYLWVTIPILGIVFAVTMTHFSVLISNTADSHFQGQAMGILQAIQLCAEVLTGLAGGAIAAENPALPLYLGSFMALICFLMFGKEILLPRSRRS